MRKILTIITMVLMFGVSKVQAEILDVCFSPSDNCMVTVAEQVNITKHTLDLAIYSLTHDEIAEVIIDAHEAGVKVRLIMDKTQAGIRYADDEVLESAGIEVIRMRSLKSGLMHHKFAILDGKKLFTGSFNWTVGGNSRNSENLILLNDKEVIEKYQKEFDKLWNYGKKHYK